MDRGFSNTLKIASFISAVFVVAIHYHSMSLIPEENFGTLNFFVQSYIRDGFGRIAVPYFALLSGYFAPRKDKGLAGYGTLLKKKAITIFVPYVIASFFIFWTSSLIGIWIGTPGAIKLGQIISWSKGILFHPGEQLWYLRDLMILFLLVPLLIDSPRKIRFSISVLLGVLWLFEFQPFPLFKGWYVISIETIFFFTFGGVLAGLDLSRFKKYLNLKTFTCLFSIWFVLVGVRILIKPDFYIWYSSEFTLISLLLYKGAILLGIPLLIIFSYQLRHNERVLYLSGYSFFIYLYHFFPLFYFRKITARIIPGEYSFYVDFPIDLLITLGLGCLFFHRFPGINNLITGARQPQVKDL